MKKMLREFTKLESKSAILLLSAAFLAILISNSPWRALYEHIMNDAFHVQWRYFQLTFSIKLFVNEVLMTIFFFLIGLEMKREMLIGEMSQERKAILPFIASVSGMLMAGLTFLAINGGVSTTTRGWAIPTATDIALSSSVLLLLGKRVPQALRLFLTMLAIIDDIIAAGIIALFYSMNLHILFLLFAAICLLALFLLNRKGYTRLPLYLILGILLWFCMLEADISPTVSGVLIGFSIPLYSDHKKEGSLFKHMEKILHPWVSFVILPMFVFVNAGLSFAGLNVSMFLDPLTLGIILGLFLGKQIGIFTACWVAVKAKITRLPATITWYQLYGMSVLCGIGFTMNLFIGFLAFPHNEKYLNLVKLGILTAALLSAVTGFTILRRKPKQ